MLYILSQEEYDALKAKQEAGLRLSEKKLQTLCTKIADTMPITVSWDKEWNEPWGCIHTVDDEHYCDHCPVEEICPNPYKMWSK